MLQENMKYYTLTDVINTAISKNFQSIHKKKDNDLSLHIINDMTYSNIWTVFSKWCADQAELGYLLNIYPFATMYFISDKQFEGISLKLSEIFLKENDLKWDDSKFSFEKIYESKLTSSVAQVQKLNFIAISSELNLPKIFVQNGLNSLFKSIAYLLMSSPSCLIDLGILGNLNCANKIVSHTPSKLKKDSLFNKKTTIKSLMSNITETKEGGFCEEPEEKEKKRSSVGENLSKGMTPDKFFMKAKKSPEQESKQGKDVMPSIKKKEIRKDKTILIPIQEKDWKISEMLDTTFKRFDIEKVSTKPILFNEYSNTKAAPFTSEKTQIPLSHRIASFYSLPLQSFIIDKTSKNIKRLYDEYFFKYKNIIFDIPATEEEEYLALLNCNVNSQKVALRKRTYNTYLKYIHEIIGDDCISNIKEAWLINIVKLCLRAYNLNNSEKYHDILNDCIRDIIVNYKISMKTSIFDYILKHPERRDKLGIPVPFRKLKEYSEAVATRPSDNNLEWKATWNKNKLTISNTLLIMCENVTKIMKYYVKKLQNTYYLDLNENDNNWNTFKLTNFSDNQKAKLDAQKAIVGDEWKKYVETILKENKVYKDQLILYFKSVSGLMSSQLRKIIINSLQYYHKFIKQFKKNSYLTSKEVFANQFNPKFPFQRSFIEIEVKEHPSGTKFTFSEELGEIHGKLTVLISDIVKCSQDVERPDNMFIKNIEKRTNLWEVPIKDAVVVDILTDIDDIVRENLDVIGKVLELYDPFVFIMQEKSVYEKFIQTSQKRDDYKKKIKFYEDKLKILREDMPNHLYMNMIKINCKEVNQILRSKLYDLIFDLLKTIQSKHIVAKSKELVEKCEKLRSGIEQPPQDEETLNKYENDCEYYKSDLLPQLFNDYNDFLEWVFFYLSYDTYSVLETNKENVNVFEQSIKTCYSNFKIIEDAIKTFSETINDKKTIFQANLEKSRQVLLANITELKKEVDSTKESLATIIFDSEGPMFLSKLHELEDRGKKLFEDLKDMIKKEGLLGFIYTTEDDRVDTCLKDLEPMINYFEFFTEYRNIQNDLDEIRDTNFPKLIQFLDKAEIFEISIQKMPTYKSRILKAKSEFDNFKSSVELGKLIASLIDIFKYEHLAEENSHLFNDNGFYCYEVCKILYRYYKDLNHQKSQDLLKNIKFKEIISSQHLVKAYNQNKVELEKLVQEWENVNQMYDVFSKIREESNIDFVTEKFKDKQFYVINRDNYAMIKSVLNKCIQQADDCLALIDTPRDSIDIIKILSEYKAKLSELLVIVGNLESNQMILEGFMQKYSQFKKKSEQLKQGENEFKAMIQVIMEKTKIGKILPVKEYFHESLANLSRILSEVE